MDEVEKEVEQFDQQDKQKKLGRNTSRVRGRGLFSDIILKAQLSSPVMYTKLYSALVAVVNTKLPENGRIIIVQLIYRFRRGLKMNDKVQSVASANFLAHLVNQRVLHELLALEVLHVLLSNPTDASVTVAIEFLKQVGATLSEVIPQGLHDIFEELRSILQHENGISKRVQYNIENLFSIRRDKFTDFPALEKELDLVEEDDQITHEISLGDESLIEEKHGFDKLLKFSLDKNYIENNIQWKHLKNEILDFDSSSGESDSSSGTSGTSEKHTALEEDSEAESVSDSESDTDSESEGPEDQAQKPDISLNPTEVDQKLISNVNSGANKSSEKVAVDLTEADLVSLRRVIYLTIMSSLDFEECAHKLLQMKIPDGLQMECVNMLIDCCAQEKTFTKFFGLLASRLSTISLPYKHCFELAFKNRFETSHRMATNEMRNIAKLFAFLMADENTISWENVFIHVKLNEEETNSSSRIFLKILFQELLSHLGLKKLKQKLFESEGSSGYTGLFPKNNLNDMRFAINFYTLIGLGGLTDQLRGILENPPPHLKQTLMGNVDDRSSSSESSSSSGSTSDSSSSTVSSSGSDSEEENGSNVGDDSNSGAKAEANLTSPRGSRRRVRATRSDDEDIGYTRKKGKR
eukprot:snap_masked-scaffold_2-processed-gene-17.32-mRNA-1 protein AED:0.06 eAED:0.10 QI:0/0/0/1/1/1/2/0/635